MQAMKIRFFIFILSCLMFEYTQAQTSDFQVWNAIELKQDLRKGFDLSAQYQSRIDQNASRFRASYFSSSLGYKLSKSLSLNADIRYSTSSSWDRLRYGFGINAHGKMSGLNLSAKLKYQYQHFLHRMPEYGINPSISNFRLKLEAERKIVKKLKAFISSEPMYRYEESTLYFRRMRNTIGLKWAPNKKTTLEASYIFQPMWNSRETIQVMQFNISFDLPKKWYRKKESNK
jgi:hypothetical protein